MPNVSDIGKDWAIMVFTLRFLYLNEGPRSPYEAAHVDDILYGKGPVEVVLGPQIFLDRFGQGPLFIKGPARGKSHQEEAGGRYYEQDDRHPGKSPKYIDG